MNAPVTAERPAVHPRWLLAALFLVYFGGMTFGAIQSPCDDDLAGFFLPSARFVVAGRPLDMYEVRVGAYPNANGPFGELAIGVALAGGRLLGLQHVGSSCQINDPYPLPGDTLGLRIWLSLIFSIFPLAIAAETIRIVDAWRPQPFSGLQRLIIWGLLLVNPGAWDAIGGYGHLEQGLAIWLALMAVRCFTQRNLALSGVLLALALLTRTSSLFVAIPLGLLLLRDQRWRDLLVWVAALGATLGLILLPFYIHDRTDLVYSLVTFRSSLPLGDGSFWTFFRHTSLEARVQPLDSMVAILGATLCSAIVIWWGRIRANDIALYGAICLASVWFAFSIKMVWSYYFFDPLAWGMVWLLASTNPLQRWWQIVWMPLFFTIMLVLTEIRTETSSPYFNQTGQARVGVLALSGFVSLSLLVFIVLLTWRLTRSDPVATATDAVSRQAA